LSDIYLFQVAAQKAQWLSARQIAVAGNVANVNTPGYRALDVQPFAAVLDASPISLASTNSGHTAPADSVAAALREADPETGEESVSGNDVSVEHEMINLGEVSRDFSMTANIRRAFHQLLLSALK
jgi:flagellar basal-body rod protein FlgB